MKLYIATLLAVIFSASTVLAQAPAATPPEIDDGDIVKITTNLIQVDVSVLDKKGNQVRNLKPEDFEVLENGKVQKISNFSYVDRSTEVRTVGPGAAAVADKGGSRIPPVPIKLRPEQVRRTIVLVVDDLGLSFGSIFWVKAALKKFVNEQMQTDDLVAIIRTGSGVGALQQFTSDKRLLLAAIAKIRWSMIGRKGMFNFEQIRPTTKDLINGKVDQDGNAKNAPGNDVDKKNEKNANEFRDETYTVGTIGTLMHIVGGLNTLPGRKGVILFSDGIKMDFEMVERLRRLVDTANRAGVVISTIDSRGLDDPGFLGPENDTRGLTFEQLDAIEGQRRETFRKDQEGLEFLAYGTGGRPIKNANSLAGGIERILRSETGYYLIAYEPEGGTFDAKTHKFNKLEVRVKVPDTRVNYRSGFFGVTDSDMAKKGDPLREQLQTALSSPFAIQDIETRLTSVFGSDPKLGEYSRALLHIDMKNVEFTDEPNGMKRVSLDVYAYVTGPDGSPISRLSKNFVFNVRGDATKRVLEKGVIFPMNVPVEKPGAYQLRMAVRDTKSGKIGSASQFIEVPDLKKDRIALSGLVVQNMTVAELKAMAQNPGQNQTAEMLEDTATRSFKRGTVLIYNYVVYNSRPASGDATQLKTYARLFRDGKLVFESAPAALKNAGQTNHGQIDDRGVLALGSDLAPGDYVLQIVAVDGLAKEKNQIAAQTIDFEIVD